MAARGYQLIVEEVGDEFELVFEGFTLTRAAGTTTLTGIVRDQAELQDSCSACRVSNAARAHCHRRRGDASLA